MPPISWARHAKPSVFRNLPIFPCLQSFQQKLEGMGNLEVLGARSLAARMSCDWSVAFRVPGASFSCILRRQRQCTHTQMVCACTVCVGLLALCGSNGPEFSSWLLSHMAQSPETSHRHCEVCSMIESLWNSPFLF